MLQYFFEIWFSVYLISPGPLNAQKNETGLGGIKRS